MRAILTSMRANLIPMQLRGPQPKGMWLRAGRFAFSSGVNLYEEERKRWEGCSLTRIQGGRMEEDSTFLGQISQVLARILDCSEWGGWASGLLFPREWWLHWPQLSSEQLVRYCTRVGKLDAVSRPEIAKIWLPGICTPDKTLSINANKPQSKSKSWN